MPREIAFHGVYMPSMTLMFFIAAGLAWAFDRLFSGYDLYRFFWHPALLPMLDGFFRPGLGVGAGVGGRESHAATQ